MVALLAVEVAEILPMSESSIGGGFGWLSGRLMAQKQHGEVLGVQAEARFLGFAWKVTELPW
jgi:hypothetical protein